VAGPERSVYGEDMPTYHFRVMFRLPEHFAFKYEESALDIRLPSGRGICTLTAYSGESIKESQWLLMKDAGDGFSKAEEAAEAGRQMKRAIMWCGAKMYMGVDAGDDRAQGVVTEYYIDQYRTEKGIRLLNELHGLQIYEEDSLLPTQFAKATVEAQVGKPIEVFVQNIRQAVDMGLELTDMETLGFELYGLSHFEAAERARFLTLVTAIESVTENKARSPEAVVVVDELIEVTRNSGLPGPEIDSMAGNLHWLKQESISKTGRDFVERFLGDKEYGGETAVRFSQRCYRARSELVHYGRLSNDIADVRSLVGDLDRLVADLLVASTGR